MDIKDLKIDSIQIKSNKIDYSQTIELLKSRDNFLILCHQDPDGDTIGSAFSLYYFLKQLNKTAKIRCNNSFPDKYKYFTEFYEDSEINGDEYIISVDVADCKLLGDNLENYKTMVNLAIDHHYSHKEFAENLLIDGDASATALIIFNLISYAEVDISKNIANAIYTGIATDTGCFKFSNTSPQAHIAAAKLIELGCDYTAINRVMFETKTKARFALEKLAYENLEFFANGKGALIKITDDMLSSTGTDQSDLDGIVAIPRQIEGVEIGIALKEKVDKQTGKSIFKASVRTNETVDASEVCAAFGGGGHKRAAGCSLDCSLDEAIDKIIKASESFL